MKALKFSDQKIFQQEDFYLRKKDPQEPTDNSFSILLDDKSNLMFGLLPKKLRSFILNVNTDPSEELNPAPIPRLPVGFSVNFTSIIIFSGDDPSRVLVSTLLKKPRPRILSTALRILRRLKGSPSAKSNCRRITSSIVVELPSTSILSTKIFLVFCN